MKQYELTVLIHPDLEMNLTPALQAPAKISSTLNITDEVLRYLLVTVDERKAKFEAKRKARAEKTKDTEESAE